MFQFNPCFLNKHFLTFFYIMDEKVGHLVDKKIYFGIHSLFFTKKKPNNLLNNNFSH